jgi:hypothetical protein
MHLVIELIIISQAALEKTFFLFDLCGSENAGITNASGKFLIKI